MEKASLNLRKQSIDAFSNSGSDLDIKTPEPTENINESLDSYAENIDGQKPRVSNKVAKMLDIKRAASQVGNLSDNQDELENSIDNSVLLSRSERMDRDTDVSVRTSLNLQMMRPEMPRAGWAKKVKAAADFIQMGSQESGHGKSFRKWGSLLSAALMIAGIALMATGVGGIAGAALLYAGWSLGAMRLVGDFLDTVVHTQIEKEQGLRTGWSQARAILGKGLLNGGLLALSTLAGLSVVSAHSQGGQVLGDLIHKAAEKIGDLQLPIGDLLSKIGIHGVEAGLTISEKAMPSILQGGIVTAGALVHQGSRWIGRFTPDRLTRDGNFRPNTSAEIGKQHRVAEFFSAIMRRLMPHYWLGAPPGQRSLPGRLLRLTALVVGIGTPLLIPSFRRAMRDDIRSTTLGRGAARLFCQPKRPDNQKPSVAGMRIKRPTEEVVNEARPLTDCLMGTHKTLTNAPMGDFIQAASRGGRINIATAHLLDRITKSIENDDFWTLFDNNTRSIQQAKQELQNARPGSTEARKLQHQVNRLEDEKKFLNEVSNHVYNDNRSANPSGNLLAILRRFQTSGDFQNAVRLYESMDQSWKDRVTGDGAFVDVETGFRGSLVYQIPNPDAYGDGSFDKPRLVATFPGTLVGPNNESYLDKTKDLGNFTQFFGHENREFIQAGRLVGEAKALMEALSKDATSNFAQEDYDPESSVQTVGWSKGGGMAMFAALDQGVKGTTFDPSGLGAGLQLRLGDKIRDHAHLVNNFTSEAEWLAGSRIYNGLHHAVTAVGLKKPTAFGRFYHYHNDHWFRWFATHGVAMRRVQAGQHYVKEPTNNNWEGLVRFCADRFTFRRYKTGPLQYPN